MTVSPPLALHSWQGRRILALLCAVAFLEVVDASITNVALPMLLGGRLADMLGRRNVLLAGTIAVGLSSLAGGSRGMPACSSAPVSRRGSALPRYCLRRCPA